MTEPALADLARAPRPSLPMRPPPAAAPSPRARRPAPGGATPSSTRSTSRSFADGNGDGTGDLAGVRARLALPARPRRRRDLVHALVRLAARRRRLRRRRLPGIDPAFGTLAEAEALIAEALALGIRTIIDVVPNHVSDQHPWFQAALAAGPGSPGARPLLVPPGHGRRTATSRRPAGGPTSRATHLDPHDEPRRHARRVVPAPVHAGAARPQLGPPGRPRASTRRSCASGSTAAPPAFASTRPPCWSRTPTLPEVPADPTPGGHPTQDRDELHDIYRGWRAVADSYPGTRVLVGEIWLRGHRPLRRIPAPGRAAHGVQLRLHGPPVGCRGPARLDRRDARRARPGRRARHLGALQPRRHPAGHALRPRGHARSRSAASGSASPTDLDLGRRRARAAALLTAALPGSLYIYQGDELGLDEVEDLPIDRDPGPDARPVRRHRPRPRRLPRAAALVAAPRPPFGFSPAGSTASRGCRSPRIGRASPSRPRRPTRTRCSTSTGRPSGSAARNPTSATDR